MIRICCLLLLCGLVVLSSGCAACAIRVKPDGRWSFYGCQLMQHLSMPDIDVKSNGLFHIQGLLSKPDAETAGAVTEAAGHVITGKK